MNQINFLETYIPVFSFRISNSQKIGLTEEEHVKICDNKATNVLNVHYFQLFSNFEDAGGSKGFEKDQMVKKFWNQLKSEVLMIKQSCNLPEHEAHLATANQSASLIYYFLLLAISMQKI